MGKKQKRPAEVVAWVARLAAEFDELERENERLRFHVARLQDEKYCLGADIGELSCELDEREKQIDFMRRRLIETLIDAYGDEPAAWPIHEPPADWPSLAESLRSALKEGQAA